MRLPLTVRLPDASSVDVLVEVDEDATVLALRRELAGVTAGALPVGAPRTDDGGLWLGPARLDDAATVAGSALVDGSVVALEPGLAPAAYAPAQRGWQLHVVSGPDSGALVELPVGRHELGRGATLPLTDRAASRRHAVLTVDERGARLADLGSANGTTLDGRPVPVEGGEEPAVEVLPGQVIGLGDSLLAIAEATRSDAAVEPGPDAASFVRAPRLLPSDREVTVVVPTPPTSAPPRRFPLAAVLAPLLLGLVMAAVVKNPLYLLFALASPVMVVSNAVGDRRAGARERRSAQATYDRELAAAQTQLAEALARETVLRRDEHPDAARTLLAATLPTRRLWERRRTDPDALVLRLGTADLPTRVRVTAARGVPVPPGQAPGPVLDVPATVSLRSAGVVGLAGPAEPLHGLLRWLLLQLAVGHPPRDLAITVLTSRARDDWSVLRWLPHARPGEPDGPLALVGNDAETVAVRVSELTALVKSRSEVLRSAGRLDAAAFSAHVVVVDGTRTLRVTPGLAQVLRDGPAVGVYALCADEEERFLPEDCRATATLHADDALHPDHAVRLDLRQTGVEPVLGVLAEQVSGPLLLTAVRALAGLRDVSPDDDEVALPDSVRLLDVLGLEPPNVDALRAHWQLGGRTTRVTLGGGLDGVFALDLRRDGPHGLIAGTTGAGKSELLQSVIASLAVGNRPDAMNFVLVDYKGGSAFKDCVALPHTVGMVTDLDTHLVERALVSLGAELKRREHQLAAVGMKDIDDYVDLAARDPRLPPLPRLLLVIDEFASMARELPDFVTGLVNIAQRGRSLGLHLLLATQRPSGVVSPEIRANTNLRICLRVTDAADSTDVLEAPDAARISKQVPGRGYVRLGHSSLVPFQSGRVGGRRPGTRSTDVPDPFATVVGWSQLGYPAPRAPAAARGEDKVDVTDLSVLVQGLCEAAAAEGVPAQRSPWLEALPERVLLGAVPPAPAPLADGDLPPLAYGLQDLPAEQEQRAATLDLASDGHLLVVGGTRSGRSQLLRTVAAAGATACTAQDLHLYGLDCGNGALLPLQDLPHCGAVVPRTSVERAARLLTRLSRELERRQTLLAEDGFADVGEQRRARPEGERLPRLLVMIDRWEGFTGSLGEVDGGRLTDVVLTLLREGSSAGIHLVITGDRSLASGRTASLTDNKLVLRMADRVDYGLVGLNARQLPDEVPPGRGFAADTGLETQIALLAADDTGQGQAAALARLAEQVRERDGELPRAGRPFRVDVLPSRIGFEQAWELRVGEPGEGFALVGVGGDDLAALGPDFGVAGPCFVIGGPPKSGRSTALYAVVRSLLRSGSCVVIGAPRPSPLRELAGEEGVLAVLTEASASADDWRAAVALAGERPVVLVLDDAEVLRDVPASDFFREVAKGMAGPGRSLVLGGDADGICTGLSGWQVEAKKSRQGLVLSPQGSMDGDLIGTRLPRSAVGQPVQPGRGLLHLGDGRVTSVTVPLR